MRRSGAAPLDAETPEEACQRALIAGARAHRVGTRQQVRAAARRFVRRHRRDAGYLGWVQRGVAASSALAVALLGLPAAPAGAAPAPFGALTGAANPLDDHDVGVASRPALGDLDCDGDLDLVAGETDVVFNYFENTGSATSPAFVPRTGAANPLDGEDVGDSSAPATADLDGDGDLDLVTGAQDGSFAVHYFPEPGRSLMLGAGIALLKLLERARLRRELPGGNTPR